MRAFIDANLLIYLNTVQKPDYRRLYREFYERILSSHRCFTNMLVIDEVLYISNRKYGFSYGDTVDMINAQVLPFVGVISIGLQEYDEMTEILQLGSFRPSDALHLSSMLSNDIEVLVSEDADFDAWRDIDRIWLTLPHHLR